ncbi:mechanosensitive ion channel family protein [Mariniphaga sediminis]|uniref:mechanosensitive ion channel family protein n=1 Tax=Mariniphaga sediminis TaxID=1628158 RepID=UPI0035618AEE
MTARTTFFTLLLLILCAVNVEAQVDSLSRKQDSINMVVLMDYQNKIRELAVQRKADSLKRIELESRLNALGNTDRVKEKELQHQLEDIALREKQQMTFKKAKIDSLRKHTLGFPVIGMLKDTLFFIHAKTGAFTPFERAQNISRKIHKLYNNDFLKVDSIVAIKSENTIDIMYGETIVMSVSETDALWNNLSLEALANQNCQIIKTAITNAKIENGFSKLLMRIGLVLLILISLWLVIWLIGKLNVRFIAYVNKRKEKWFHSLSYKDYTFLSQDQELSFVLFFLKIVHWFIIVMILYIAFPLVFSIFTFTRGWADDLLNLVWSPFKSMFIAIWHYLPNLFSILAIFFVMKYFVRLVKYIFSEIESEKLKISGFHADWAMPTYSIVKFLLYAFMFVLIFPYLPGSDSNIFKGVSVFLGILFSLGSSSAIANMVAGLVITYMRPFKIGDRIKLGDISGDVVEKTLLVTRLRTVKNEEITIPNSSILSGNTTNYSTYTKTDGLIVHTNVTIGYDIPWKEMHQALIDASLLTEGILPDPKPFVLQTSLDDFYITYQLNAYTREANRQAKVYSALHQNIQDVCNQRGIEIMSPHYRAQRDGEKTTIPAFYLPKAESGAKENGKTNE